MNALFTTFEEWLASTPAVAVAASALWGVLSMLLSPCNLASIPLVIAFVGGHGPKTTRIRAATLSGIYAAGVLLSIAAVGGMTAAVGHAVHPGSWINYVVVGIFLVAGLHLMGAVPLPLPERKQPRGRGLPAALALGAVFGLSLCPCRLGYMAPVLGVVLGVSSSQTGYAVALLAAYAAGYAGVIVVAGTSTAWVQRLLNWNERSRGLTIFRRVCGVLVFLAALLLLYEA